MSLDPESLLGIKSAVLKAAVAGTMLGVLWRREFKLAEALVVDRRRPGQRHVDCTGGAGACRHHP